MGRDGVAGLEAVHRAGGLVCAQDETSCAVFGMPRAAIEAGIVDFILPLDSIPRRIADAVDVS
jgi:two-component system chemotaxis response regulator CheB